MPTKLYVGNVPNSINSRQLKELFEKYGKVLECDIVKDYAFVHMEDAAKAKASIAALNDFNLKGNRIRVEVSTTKLRNRSSFRDDSPPARRDSDDFKSSRYRSEYKSDSIGPDRHYKSIRDNYSDRRSRPYESRYGRDSYYRRDSPRRHASPITPPSSSSSRNGSGRYRSSKRSSSRSRR